MKDDSLTYKELEELLYFWSDKYKEKEQEIKRLQEDVGNYVNIVLHDRKEIDRLNNIINELEEDIKVGFYEYESNDSDYIEGYNDGAEKTSKYFINRIKELKENK